MIETHVTGDLGAFALGALDPEDEQQVRAHLAGCSDCRELLAEYRSVAQALSAERERVVLPPWENLRDRVAPRPVERLWVRQRRMLVGGWVATAALLAIVSGWTAWDHLSTSGNDVATLARSSGGPTVLLAATSAGSSSPSGRVYISQDGSQGGLAVDGLPATGGPYEVWFVRPDQTRVSAGTFQVDPRGAALVKLQMPDTLAGFSGVTVCPAGPDWQWNADLLAGPLY
jgi:anti-sigma factor RsiW